MTHTFILTVTDEDLQIMRKACLARRSKYKDNKPITYTILACIDSSLHYGIQDKNSSFVTRLSETIITKIGSYEKE